jgi:hypothetical protein
VNQADDGRELEALRRCVQRGRPYGGPEWQKEIAKRLEALWVTRPEAVGLARTKSRRMDVGREGRARSASFWLWCREPLGGRPSREGDGPGRVSENVSKRGQC